MRVGAASAEVHARYGHVAKIYIYLYTYIYDGVWVLGGAYFEDKKKNKEIYSILFGNKSMR